VGGVGGEEDGEGGRMQAFCKLGGVVAGAAETHVHIICAGACSASGLLTSHLKFAT
jgi:hypothetical protein